LNFTASESMETPVVTIAGHSVATTAGSEISYFASYTMTASDAEGPVAFTINFTDLSGNTGTQVTTTTNNGSIMYDRTNPLIANASVNKQILTVPDHTMRDIKVSYEVTDRNSYNVVLLVTSNEAENGLGDGDTGPDMQIVDEHQVRLRAERSATGNGRIYTITITATDIAGNISTQILTVTAPLNQGIEKPTSMTVKEAVIDQKGIHVAAYPNPATDYFNLNIQSSSSTPITVIITDAAGRLIEKKTGIAANSKLIMGHSYLPGLYIIQAIQGNDKFVLKLVKLAD